MKIVRIVLAGLLIFTFIILVIFFLYIISPDMKYRAISDTNDLTNLFLLITAYVSILLIVSLTISIFVLARLFDEKHNKVARMKEQKEVYEKLNRLENEINQLKSK